MSAYGFLPMKTLWQLSMNSNNLFLPAWGWFQVRKHHSDDRVNPAARVRRAGELVGRPVGASSPTCSEPHELVSSIVVVALASLVSDTYREAP